MREILVVGAGLFGAVCARELLDRGYKVKIIEQRNHIGGNCFTQKRNNITVHEYGPHIFHTKNEKIWNYIRKFSKFNNYVHKTFIRLLNGNTYSFPFNLLTYEQILGTSGKIKSLTDKQKEILFNNFIKNYSEKQWNRNFSKIPKKIINRLPIKFSYNNDYFEGEFQGIPINGYTKLIEKLMCGAEIELNKKFTLNDISNYQQVIFSGCLDELFDYKFGKLEYRSLKFQHEFLDDCDDFQGNTVVNYPDKEFPFTRIIEHKHFEFNNCKGTIITKEYPSDEGAPYYSINDNKNQTIYLKYLKEAKKIGIVVGGRLGSYQYLNMDETIAQAIKIISNMEE